MAMVTLAILHTDMVIPASRFRNSSTRRAVAQLLWGRRIAVAGTIALVTLMLVGPTPCWGQDDTEETNIDTPVEAAAASPIRRPLWETTKFQKPALIRYDGMVNHSNQKFLERSVADARRRGADVVVIEVDSPGGYLIDAFATGDYLAELTDVPTIIFVPDEALSGAAILALGATDIVLTPDARFGDAGVIEFDNEGLFQFAPEKLRSDAALRIRELAAKRQRSPGLAEAMVDQNLVIYESIDPKTGSTLFLSEPERDAYLAQNGDLPGKAAFQPIFETREGHFFEVTGRRAVELGLASATVTDRNELADQLGVKSFSLVYRWGWRDTAGLILSSWLVSALFLIVGLIALKVEFSAPGLGVGGLIAVFCFVMFFYGRFVGGTANWLEVVLFLSGLVFLAVELFLLPGFGIAGLAGLVLIIGSLILAFQDFTIPQSEADWRSLAWGAATVLGVGVASFVGLITVGNYFGAGVILGPLTLKPPTAEELAASEDHAPFGSGGDGTANAGMLTLGQMGRAGSTLRPSGKGDFGGRTVDVITDGDYVERGTVIEIVEIRGSRIVVQPKV